jgi:hypothetical protein
MGEKVHHSGELATYVWTLTFSDLVWMMAWHASSVGAPTDDLHMDPVNGRSLALLELVSAVFPRTVSYFAFWLYLWFLKAEAKTADLMYCGREEAYDRKFASLLIMGQCLVRDNQIFQAGKANIWSPRSQK